VPGRTAIPGSSGTNRMERGRAYMDIEALNKMIVDR
jgi:hypothetical protein